MDKLNQTSFQQNDFSIFLNDLHRYWYKFSRNPLSIIGGVTVFIIVLCAIFAPIISPHPPSAGTFLDFDLVNQSPNFKNFMGTDQYGRDILTRILFGYRYSLGMSTMVLIIVVPVGVLLGLVSGYYRGTWIDTTIMRVTDIFVSVPSLVLALAVTSILEPNIFNAMMAVSIMWWPWYTRLVYGVASSIKGEYFIQAAELTGASKTHILFREMLPNCISPLLVTHQTYR